MYVKPTRTCYSTVGSQWVDLYLWMIWYMKLIFFVQQEFGTRGCSSLHGPLTRYVKLQVAHVSGMTGKTFPAFPAHAQTAILRIWQEAHAWRCYIWFRVYISWYIWQMVKFPGSIIWHGCRLYIWCAIWRGDLRQFGSLFGKKYSRNERFAYLSFSGIFFRLCHDTHGFVSKTRSCFVWFEN